jgi:2-methylcitrate dehydratase PrpD
VHPTSPVLSATLAAAEAMHASGKQLLRAYQVGVEVCCRIFDSTHVNHTLHGCHVTGTCGTMGAAAGMAALGNASVALARTVLGIAGSMASGVQANVGTMVKSFHVGHAAECAIVAHDLAKAGYTASGIVLESPRGFFRALGGGHDESRIRGKLGHPWSFVERGIWLKPFPTGSLGHPGMTKLLELIAQHDIKPDQVRRVRVKTSESNHHTLQHHRPETGLQAKFSFEFFLSAILIDRKCGLTQFTDEYVNRPQVQEMMRRIEFTTYSDEEAKANGYNIVTTFLEIDLGNGRTISARADHGKGNIADPMSEDEVAAKFRDCAEYAGWDKAKTERAIELILRLDTLQDVCELTANMGGS